MTDASTQTWAHPPRKQQQPSSGSLALPIVFALCACLYASHVTLKGVRAAAFEQMAESVAGAWE